MSVHIRNKSRKCIIGLPVNKAERKSGMSKIVAAGGFPHWMPGDVVKYESPSVWNNIQHNGFQHFVYCEDPQEIAEFVREGAIVDEKRPHGFFGSHLVLEDCSAEFASLGLTHSERLLTAKKMAELEKQALEGETAKALAEQLAAAKAAADKEIEDLRAQLASERTQYKRGR